jgi:hypothetical protein
MYISSRVLANIINLYFRPLVEYGTLSFVVHISSSPILLPKTNMIRIIND